MILTAKIIFRIRLKTQTILTNIKIILNFTIAVVCSGKTELIGLTVGETRLIDLINNVILGITGVYPRISSTSLYLIILLSKVNYIIMRS